jgi:integrase
MTIDQARKQATVVLAEIARGNDPQEQKRALRRQCTLRELFGHYLETHAKVHCREKSWREDQRLFNRHLPVWHARRISTITTADIAALHGRIGKKTPCQANRLLTLLCKLLNYGRRTLKSDRANPCEGVRRFHEAARERFLSAAELKRLFRALKSEPEPFRSFFLLLLLTGARKGNVQAMRWRDVDLDARLWRIPNDQSKNREPLTVVLSPESLEILRRRQADVNGSEYVFPGCGKTGHLVEPKTPWGHVVKRAKLNDCRMHDLRRTLGSWQAAGGASLLIIGKSLGHRSESATRIYARLATDPVRESVEKATVAMIAAAGGVTLGGR